MNNNDKRFGKKIIASEATRHIIPVMIKPDDTIEPIDFLSLLPEKYETLRERTIGIPLETNVIITPKILIAT